MYSDVAHTGRKLALVSLPLASLRNPGFATSWILLQHSSDYDAVADPVKIGPEDGHVVVILLAPTVPCQ